MKKTALALFVALLFAHAAAAQKAIIYKNFANYFHNNRSDWTLGYRMKNGNYFTVGLENWHFRRTLFPRIEQSGFGGTETSSTISFGRRLNVGVLHFYDKKMERKWHFYDHFFGQIGYHYHETSTTFNAGTTFPSTFTGLDKLWGLGFGIENGFVFSHKKIFLGPAITNGYVLYFNKSSEPVFAFGLERFNKGMYLWMPMVRFVVGCRI